MLATAQGFDRQTVTSSIYFDTVDVAQQSTTLLVLAQDSWECQIKGELTPEQTKMVQLLNQLSFPCAFAFSGGDWEQEYPQMSYWRGVSWFCKLRSPEKH